MTAEELKSAIEAHEQKGQEILTAVEEGKKTAEEGKAMVDALNTELQPLLEERKEMLRQEEIKALRGSIDTLGNAVKKLMAQPHGEFVLTGDEEAESGKAVGDDAYASGEFSVYRDIRLANKGNDAARERLIAGLEAKGLNAEGKAMTEGTANQGGYLVRPLVERQLVEARELDNVLRGLCSKLNVTTNGISLDQLGLATTAGWVAELGTKPEGTSMTLATVTASVFTAAGLATISNQLLADSNPAVDQLVTADLAKRLVALEETAFIAGTGTNQPLGILNTPGVTTTTVATTPVDVLLDAILDSIAKVESSHGTPSAILMHPRTWTRILKAKSSGGAYLFAAPSANLNTPADVTSPRTIIRGPQKVLWGYPVVTSNRIPTNLGTGTNESRVIVGDFREALILDRQGITVDESPHVFFTTNQTVFRSEMRVGFTAARTPAAFDVIGGAGLANG